MKSNLKLCCGIIAITVCCLLVLSANSATAAVKGGNLNLGITPPAMKGGNPNPGIAAPNSKPFGLSYNEWAVRASQWYHSQPFDYPADGPGSGLWPYGGAAVRVLHRSNRPGNHDSRPAVVCTRLFYYLGKHAW